ncbi:hypothetical protein CJU94_18925 [Paraburkholderia aromaticivorans]|uniref:Uncharacterized protein n=1 Tax=Paraburkholderia aromaticivorans TaxID=2026199 RepID=A0A248VLY4_9BURK|nr:hypothetical protein CJU94_18925 [Paraburkholderia aromaticivorans]
MGCERIAIAVKVIQRAKICDCFGEPARQVTLARSPLLHKLHRLFWFIGVRRGQPGRYGIWNKVAVLVRLFVIELDREPHFPIRKLAERFAKLRQDCLLEDLVLGFILDTVLFANILSRQPRFSLQVIDGLFSAGSIRDALDLSEQWRNEPRKEGIVSVGWHAGILAANIWYDQVCTSCRHGDAKNRGGRSADALPP